MTDHLLGRLVAAVGTQYVVEAEIGRGGMAVVYSATDPRLHRRVAIKVLPPELAFNADVRERFLREAQTSAQLSHPNIVPIYTVDEAEGLVFFVMALVDGESLAERLARDTRLQPDDARSILVAVADALAYAHQQGVVHRDVKPDNIMLERRTGRALVTDFGIARAAAGESRLTLTGIAIGTPAYMSPEQALGERELDGRSDIYSLGVIGYQMIAGETPFRASNAPAMLVKHVSEMPRPLLSLRPDAPSSLVNAIARALAKKPEDRWPTAGAFRDALAGTTPAPAFRDAPRENPWGEARAPQLPPAPVPAPQPAWQPPPIAAPQMPPMPAMPAWGSRADWRQWRHAHRVWERERHRRDHAMKRVAETSGEYDASLPVELRISKLRRKMIGAIGTIGTTATINLLTAPHFLWFLIPSAAVTLGVLSNAAHLWSDGVPLSRIFSRGNPEALPSPRRRAAEPALDPALALAPLDVLRGPHGDAVRRAAADRHATRELIGKLAPAEREMIPDIAPTLDALAERVGALALTLHRLDADVNGASVPALDQRLAALRSEAGETPTPEQERRLSLLARQRGSIGELSERRGALVAQMESAALALQNLRLDLLKLRSSGLGSAMAGDDSATQEARALSRDIVNAVEAVREADRL